ncbi:MAG: radical SAM protein [Ruminococcus sp.]|nr:radical SAM protein [Ruminococcus sp.]
MLCTLCPRNCNAVRTDKQCEGFCQSFTLPKVARIAPHFWEEPCISGSNGSGAVFFCGCNLKCVFCQNYEISALNQGKYITVSQLAECYKELEKQGVHNINLVNACHYVFAILESFKIYKPSVPVVYNSSGYEKAETLKLLENSVDIYLPDFKYSDNKLAEEYSSAPDYRETAIEAIDEMVRQKGAPVFDDDGMLKSGVIVRHLILPNHTKNSIGVLEILKERYNNKILVSLMGQYIPHGKASQFKKLSRKITKREYNKVADKLLELELDGFMQELSAADEKFIPKWNY